MQFLMRSVLALFLATTSLASTAALAVECPVGAGESTLTIRRVMYNFRDYLDAPDKLASKGQSHASEIADAEIAAVIADLDVALACANRAQNDQSPEMTPQTAGTLSGAARDEYMNDYLTYMDSFVRKLTVYRQGYVDLSVQAADQRNFSVVWRESMEVRSLATEAHRYL